MNSTARPSPKRSRLRIGLVSLGGFVFIAGLFAALYQPDRPVPDIVPGSSPGPTFVVQMVRPRAGLPLGGILPPAAFGLDAHLGFRNTSDGAVVREAGQRRIALAADGWEVLIVLDRNGQVTSETEVVFDLMFQERIRRVRCRPGSSVVGTVEFFKLKGSDEVAGRFDIELPRCEDAESGQTLGWPPRPFVLHGSFDRLPVQSLEEATEHE